jgi:hypothetical protein
MTKKGGEQCYLNKVTAKILLRIQNIADIGYYDYAGKFGFCTR